MRSPISPLAVLRRFAALLLLVLLLPGATRAELQVYVDVYEQRSTPVQHQYIHGVILDDAKFQALLPADWNGKIAIFTRGFSGTEFSTGAWLPAALAKGYAFASSDEGWNRVQIRNEPEDSYYESRQRLLELTLYMKNLVVAHYGKEATRTLIMGGSNGGHHTKWMVEEHPTLFDGGIAGYGFNSQVSQWGSIATTVRNYDVIAPRIDDIIAKRTAAPEWNPFREPLSPPLTPAQLQALRNIYAIPARLPYVEDGFRYDVGRWPGSEAILKEQYPALVSYLRDSMPRLDPTFNPNGGALTDDELGLWRPERSPGWVQRELRRLDLSGDLLRPVIIMHGTYDVTVSPGETEGYKRLVERVLGPRAAEEVLAVYYIPGMGHGGAQFNALIDEQIDALEAWIDYRQTNGASGAPAPQQLGDYLREPTDWRGGRGHHGHHGHEGRHGRHGRDDY